MIACGVIQRDRVAVEPGHFPPEKVIPLTAQARSVARQPHDFVAGEANELRRLRQCANDRVDLAERALMGGARQTGTTVAVNHELLPARRCPQHRDGGTLEHETTPKRPF